MYTYSQKTGEFLHDGKFVGTGYSGTGKGRNNPKMQDFHAVGPVPQGVFKIGTAYRHKDLGPVTMNLEPQLGSEMFGRSLFRIHGDNTRHDASHGCIILGPAIRNVISRGTDRDLTVVA